jgi:hypothetical protein
MPSMLENVIQLGGRALEVEDSLLSAASHRRNQKGGLLRVELERYYQYIVWKSLLDTYDAQIECSREGGYLIDLVIKEQETEHFFEMKYWHEESSVRVNSDIRRLQSFSDGGNLLVFSANPKDQTDSAIKYLIGEAPLPSFGEPTSCYRFPTENPGKTSTPFEFWFAGWHIPSARGHL